MPFEEIKSNNSFLFEAAFRFANIKHANQKIKGSNLPYISHISNVCFVLLAMPNLEKYDSEFMLTVAALHDTLEDTSTEDVEILDSFGPEVLSAVKALSKNNSLPKQEQLIDSLERIIKQPKEVHLVKIADRIDNLNPPPHIWGKEKVRNYYSSSIILYDKLKNADVQLAEKLIDKIRSYQMYCD